MHGHSLIPIAALLFSFLISTCQAIIRLHDHKWSPDYVLEATATNISIDCHSRYSVVINGTAPGPTLYLKEGQTTWVRVWNRIQDQNFTVHWHGLSERTAPFSDGTPLVGQWPIAPNEYFDYEIHPDIGDAGTYFYHSHVGFQALTAHGALIVEDAGKPPYKYDGDIELGFADFFQANDSTIVNGLLANPFKWSGESQAILVNGRSGNASFSNATDDSCKPTIIDIMPGATYRVRFIGRTAISLVSVGIEGHNNLTIIEADGEYTRPFYTDHLQVATGQRFSILLEAKSIDELNTLNQTQFWIRYESRDRPKSTTGYALLRYKMPGVLPHRSLPSDLPSTPPVALPAEVNDWMEYSLEALKPLEPFPTLAEVTRTVYITVEQFMANGTYKNGSPAGVLEWGQNGLPWQETATAAQNYNPYLVNLYLTGQVPNYTAAVQGAGYDPATKAFPALAGETLDIVWLSNSGPSGGWDFHPMHAHGAHYWDLGAGNGTYNAIENEKHFANGYIPARRDTTILYRYATSGSANTTAGWRAWRIRVTENDVGAWMMHCHILQHMIMGMQTVWVFGSAEQILAKFPTEPYVAGYLNYGGSAYGNDTYDPLVAEHSF